MNNEQHSPDQSNLSFIIDTNAVIHALTEQHTKENMHEILKGRNCKIIICSEVFKELFESKKLSNARWDGYTKNDIITQLKEAFGDRIMDYSTSDKVKSESISLEKKYNSEGLHYPDSILLAIAKIEGWKNIITGDNDLANCCSLENISCFDQNISISKIVEIEKKPPSEILSKLRTNYTVKELEMM